MKVSILTYKHFTIAFSLATLIASVAAAPTRIGIPANKYGINDVIRIGWQAEANILRKLQCIPEKSLSDNYIETVGHRLVSATLPRYRHYEFVYRFDVVNVRDVNAFALPGGPKFVDLIGAASNEGQFASVLAHELAQRRISRRR